MGRIVGAKALSELGDNSIQLLCRKLFLATRRHRVNMCTIRENGEFVKVGEEFHSNKRQPLVRNFTGLQYKLGEDPSQV